VSYFKAKLHETRLRLGLYPRHRWGAYSAPPGPLAGGRGGRTTGKGKGEGTWEGRGRKGENHTATFTSSPVYGFKGGAENNGHENAGNEIAIHLLFCT